jgi:hypothetical protein
MMRLDGSHCRVNKSGRNKWIANQRLMDCKFEGQVVPWEKIGWQPILIWRFRNFISTVRLTVLMQNLQSFQLLLGIVQVSSWNALQASQNLFKKFVPPMVDSQRPLGWVWPLRMVKFVEGCAHDFPPASHILLSQSLSFYGGDHHSCV